MHGAALALVVKRVCSMLSLVLRELTVAAAWFYRTCRRLGHITACESSLLRRRKSRQRPRPTLEAPPHIHNMYSLVRRIVGSHPRASLAVLAGTAVGLAWVINRALSTQHTRLAQLAQLASPSQLRYLIDVAHARLADKLMPLGKGSVTQTVSDEGIPVRWIAAHWPLRVVIDHGPPLHWIAVCAYGS